LCDEQQAARWIGIAGGPIKSGFKLFRNAILNSNSSDSKSGVFEKSADFFRVVALKFDFASADGSAAAAGLAGFAGEAVDFGIGDMGLESGNDDDGFAASLGFFASENHATIFAGRFGGVCTRLGGAFGESVEFEGGEGGLEGGLAA
jgi:hypothetical protein